MKRPPKDQRLIHAIHIFLHRLSTHYQHDKCVTKCPNDLISEDFSARILLGYPHFHRIIHIERVNCGKSNYRRGVAHRG